jgi:carboxymethylenebutenolidase
MTHHISRVMPWLALFQLGACGTTQTAATNDHATHADVAPVAGLSVAAQDKSLPAGAEDALARVNSSPRHGEWAVIKLANGDSLRAWVVYPERKTKAPVVVVIHEIFGLSTWIRAVADQFAADGFLAIAPDLLTMKNLPTGPDSVVAQAAVAAIRTLDPAMVQQQLDAAARYAMGLPAAQQRYGVVGFCWGGGTSFAHAVHAPTLGAAVVYYGVSPPTASLASVRAPVLGLYAGNDARVNATVPPADSAMKSLGKTYSVNMFEGAGHGYLRQQSGQNGANMNATRQAWPATIAWFRKYLDS